VDPRAFVAIGIVAMMLSSWMLLSRKHLVSLSRDYRLLFKQLGLPYYTDHADETMNLYAAVLGIALGSGCIAAGCLLLRGL